MPVARWGAGTLARAQEQQVSIAASQWTSPPPMALGDFATTVFRVYTEDVPGTTAIVARYVSGVTIYHVDGIWQGVVERGLVVEIIGTLADRKNIVAMASDIARTNNQAEVLVIWSTRFGTELVRVYGGK